MTAAAYMQLGELLVHFNLPNYNAALTKVLELMSGQTPPYPKVKPGDRPGPKCARIGYQMAQLSASRR
ncbi:hypothetical protein JCM19237_278 [Photobacterium aphoticum]|uniref:Uncharacterized protein n=1 Tax=Photobacterium aphoticum TaxID=754436 RepID=A0A090R046_9GAMM|nr:hypothetical protein JCM19237_278 [Photobacterium aphoticum]